ncbi:hypothetical protein AGMMS50268_14710 [Spirochaetia bacterium]|nr:hypothetical protein AGMMS50268_14710 [Spirochaetia bacterium]
MMGETPNRQGADNSAIIQEKFKVKKLSLITVSFILVFFAVAPSVQLWAGGSKQVYKQLRAAVIADNYNDVVRIIGKNKQTIIQDIINLPDDTGDTLLHSAVKNQNIRITGLLFQNGARADIKDRNQKIPADYANGNVREEILRLLGFLDDNPSVPPDTIPEQTPPVDDPNQIGNIPEPPGSIPEPTPPIGQPGPGLLPPPPPGNTVYPVTFGSTDADLLKAVKSQDLNKTKELLLRRQNANVADSQNNNALFYAIDSENLGILHLLIENNINVNTKNRQGQLPLLFAVGKANLPIINALLTAGASINNADTDGNTPILLAAQMKNASLVTLFLVKGARTDDRDKSGNTLLHIAIKNNDLPTTRALLERGADVYLRNSSGVTALELLKSSQRGEFNKLAEQYE